MSYISGGGGGGGGGTPGGASTDVQINLAGAFYGDDGFKYNPATGIVSIGGLLDNQITFKGAATTFPALIESIGLDASVPIQLKPKGPQGFTQLGPNTYGASGWAGFNVSLEIRRVESTESSVDELYVESYLGDFANASITGLDFQVGTHAAPTHDTDLILGLRGSAFSSTPSGFTTTTLNGSLIQAILNSNGTVTTAIGAYYEVGALPTSGGHISSAYGAWVNMRNSSGVNDTGSAYGMYVAPYGDFDFTTHAFYSFYSGDISASNGFTVSANPYYLWLDSQGVFRIKEDNTFDSVGQAIMALYNPQVTKYTPGAANYERIVQRWNGNVAEYGSEKGGTGTLRGLRLLGAFVDIPAAGAASSPAARFTGAWFTGGSGTTTTPQILIEPAGTTAGTAWSTGGTALGFNAPSGFTGHFMRAFVNNSLRWYVDTVGNFVSNQNAEFRAGFLSLVDSSNVGAAFLDAPATNNIRLNNWAGTGFGLLQFGGVTSGSPAIKRSTTVLQARLADDSAFATYEGKFRTVDDTTGAGTVLGFGANCPASTLTGPYTWIKATSQDGSTVYMPAYK